MHLFIHNHQNTSDTFYDWLLFQFIQVWRGVAREIASKIKPLHTNSKYVFWFKVSSDLVNLDQDIIFGIVYIPAENTVYSSQDALREIENEYNNFSINYKYISLIGDFNGRTADEDDFFFSSENH